MGGGERTPRLVDGCLHVEDCQECVYLEKQSTRACVTAHTSEGGGKGGGDDASAP